MYTYMCLFHIHTSIWVYYMNIFLHTSIYVYKRYVFYMYANMYTRWFFHFHVQINMSVIPRHTSTHAKFTNTQTYVQNVCL